MKGWNEKPRKKGRIEIIPMIDVMMFLLVFFVLGFSFHPFMGLLVGNDTSGQSCWLLLKNEESCFVLKNYDGFISISEPNSQVAPAHV